MSDQSPNSLQPPKVTTVKMRKWPLFVTALAVQGLFGVLFYSVNFGQNTKKKEVTSRPIVTEEKPLVASEGRGLSLPPPQRDPEGLPSAAAPGKPLMVVRDEKKAENEDVRNLRRQKAQEFTKALSSPLVAKRANEANREKEKSATVSVPSVSAPTGQQLDPAIMTRTEDAYNPAADRDKEGFFKRSDRGQWLSSYTREAGLPYEIKTGTVIPGIMITGVNSDLPGSMIAQVSQNVYDTATGRQLLIPQGSKLYGAYDSRVIYGQSRVLIAWNRVVFPDGSAVTLGAMPGTDMSGYAGFTDQVDNHYLRIFGSSMLMSLITGSTSYAVDSVSNGAGSGNDATTVQDAMASALAAQLGQTTQTLLQRNLNIKPTLDIRPGYQFNVVVTKDVAFRSAYR